MPAFGLEGTSRAEVKNTGLVNSFGESIPLNINAYQQVQVTSEIVNKQDTAQNFVYIVQILDHNGVTVKLTWFSATLNPRQTLSPAISWSTDRPGTYTAEIYVWDSITEASPLAPATQIKIIVS